jgi:hypothetical protein
MAFQKVAMRSICPFFVFLFFLNCFLFAGGQNMVINEMMSSNAVTLADKDGDFSDWIELYNAGADAVQLEGWGLTDNKSNPLKWIFPRKSLAPKQYLVVWASGKNYRPDEGELHTSFSISAQGEEIVLTNPQGVKVDEFLPVRLKSDISYGRTPDGSQNLKFFNQPTPGKSNSAIGFNEILFPPVFSNSGGFYRDPFLMSLSSTQAGVSVVYTLDGSEPDINDVTGVSYPYLNKYRQNPNTGAGPILYRSTRSNVYKSPISVNDRTSDGNQISQVSTTYDANPWYFPSVSIDKAVVVRARTVKEGALSSEIITNTYFVRNQGNNPYSLPVISFTAPEEDLFDFYKGIYVAGIDFENWRSSNPSATANGGSAANYHREGDEWEYPAHFELFDNVGNRVLAQNIGFRMHGNWSNSSPFKSLRIYARNDYGNSYLNYPFFKTRGDSAYKRIILRNSGNDIWYTMFRDAAMQEMTRHMNFETQAYQPAVLFINGEYWGIHNIRERYDKYYLARNFGVNEEQLDILENNMTVDEGGNTHYAETLGYLGQNGVRDESNYATIKTRIDVNSYMDYVIAQIFMVNTDWPGNNIKYWRLQTSQYQPEAGPGKDGRWRWLLFDADYTFGIYTPNEYTKDMMTFTTQTNGPVWPNPDWSTFLFRKLLENESFKTAFIVRFCDELNTAFKPEVVTLIINRMMTAIEPEMSRHILRWKMPSSMSNWYNNVNQMRSFAEQRPAYARNHLRQFFNLSADFTLTADVSNPQQGHVVVNTIPLVKETRGVADNPYPWKGAYFRNVPLRLEAVPAPGYEFVKWTSANSVYTNSVIVLNPSVNLNITAVFQKSVQENKLPPVITRPQANAVVENSVSVGWTAVSEALWYELQIADNAEFLNPFVLEDSIVSVSFSVSLPKNGTSCFVRVRAISATGAGEWSGTVPFSNSATPAEIAENQENHLLVYPNPFRQVATLDLYLTKSGMVRIALFNMAGKKIREFAQEYLQAGIHTFRLDGDPLPPGPYIIICNTESDIFRHKLVKY